MDQAGVFEGRVAGVARRAAAAAQVKVDDAATEQPNERSAREQYLIDALGLTEDELDFIWTLVGRAIEPRVTAYLKAVWGNEVLGGCSLAHHLALAPLIDVRRSALLRILSPSHPLRAAGFLSPHDEVLDVTTRWSLAPRVWQFLRGDDELDPEITKVGGLVVAPMWCALGDEQRAAIDRLSTWLERKEPVTIVLDGPSASGRRTAVALAAQKPTIAIDVGLLEPAAVVEAIRALRRETTLRAAIPVIANLDEVASSLAPRANVLLQLSQVLDSFPGPIVITTTRPGLEILSRDRPTLRQSWPLPDIRTRRQVWATALGDTVTPEELDRLAIRYALGAGGISASVRAARHRTAASEPTFSDLSAGVQDTITERLGELAHRIEVRQTWDELVLPPDTLDSVQLLIARIRHAHHVLETWNFKRKLARGTGVAALFSGPPGTGKTMVAGLIARELQLELYQVDLSRIVSKWIGETEKQLAKVFEAAEAGHALLLFDEADALFAKRSAEVKSAVDRYANLEVNYLLQRVEAFGGIVILTTNLDTSLDPALRRRLATHIVFDAPEREERLRLWRTMLDTGAPLDSELSLQRLADEFEAMSGANIRNAVISAAFLAAADRSSIKFTHLRRAAMGEYRAMGRVLSKDVRG